MRNYWLRIGFGALAIFAVGMVGITLARQSVGRVRGVVEAGCRSVLEQVALALGPRPLALDLEHSARVADLEVYLRQHHGRRDLAELGSLLKGKADVDRRSHDEDEEVAACGR